MSEQVTTQSKDIETEIQERKDNIYRSYNYVGTKETIAYLFNDWSNTFNIGGFNHCFLVAYHEFDAAFLLKFQNVGLRHIG